LVYNVFATISLVPLLILTAALPDRTLYAIPWPWTALALILQALAGLALLVSIVQTGLPAFLGLEQLIVEPGSQPERLTEKGLYRRVRHPLYTAGILILWLAPIMTINLLALNLGLTAYLVIGAFFEERKLVHEFGDAYRDYRRRTPMFIPKIY
jgi:protein-S-isoprenylcysteine O-methyltransferase Ste14